MLSKVREAIKRWSMVESGGCVAVGLSGGADSTALLYALSELSGELGITVRAIHVNHGIRGADADADQADAERKCRELGVKIDCFTVDVPGEAAKRGIGIEECARVLRYECFERVVREQGCKVATAHTVSDSAETVLLNLVRGCGTGGLKGIPPVRGNVIRPLILATREDVEAFCREKGLSFVTDKTNFDRSYRRNFIRMDVVPMMKLMNPSFLEAVGRLTMSAAEDDGLLCAMAADAVKSAVIETDGAPSYSLEKLRELHPAIRRRAIMMIVSETTGHVPEYRHTTLIEHCMEIDSGAVETVGGWTVRADNGILSVSRESEADRAERWERAMVRPVTLLPDGRRAVFTILRRNDYDECLKNDPKLFKNALNYDIINDKAFFRNRREGDCFTPAGRGITKQLKKLFQEVGVPAAGRDGVVILENSGRIAWMDGFGVSEECRVTANTENVLMLQLEQRGADG